MRLLSLNILKTEIKLKNPPFQLFILYNPDFIFFEPYSSLTEINLRTTKTTFMWNNLFLILN